MNFNEAVNFAESEGAYEYQLRHPRAVVTYFHGAWYLGPFTDGPEVEAIPVKTLLLTGWQVRIIAVDKSKARPRHKGLSRWRVHYDYEGCNDQLDIIANIVTITTRPSKYNPNSQDLLVTADGVTVEMMVDTNSDEPPSVELVGAEPKTRKAGSR